MVFILGASCLDHALRTLSAPSQKRVKETCFTKPGLSFNLNARDSQKTIQYYLHHFLSIRKILVIWHDAINNSISKHLSNNNRSLSTDQLKSHLLRHKNITAIVYCRRNGTDKIEKELEKTGILVLNIVEDFISKRKIKDQKILNEKYKELHQPPSLELKTLLLLRRYSADLSTLKAKKKRNRRAIHNRLKALKLQVTPPCKLLMYQSILWIYLSENKYFLRVV